ncbi:zinc-binding dehydrogenase [Niallia sp. JL1B1071]
MEEGKVKPVTDRSYSLKEVSKALQYFEKGHAQGKVMITME